MTPATINVVPAPTPTALDNDYTRIQNAVNTAVTGDTISLAGTFNFTETNAAASWAKGADGLANTGDDFSVFVPDNKTAITMTAASLGAATIQGPGDKPQLDLEAFLYFDGTNYDGWTISNLKILDFDLGIGMYQEPSPPLESAYDNTVITNNQIRIATDLNGVDFPNDQFQNIGIQYSFGTNQTIKDNLIQIPGNGVSSATATEGDFDTNPYKFATSVGIQCESAGPASYDGLLITGNTIQVLKAQASHPERVIGIWENGNASRSNMTISNNTFENLDVGNKPALNLQQAFWISSISNTVAGTTVTYSGNTVSGVSLGFRFVSDVDFAADPNNSAAQFTNNTLTNVWAGFLVQNNGIARLSGNSMTGIGIAAGADIGILVRPGSHVNLDSAVATNTLSGFASAIFSQGSTVIADAVMTGNGVGITVDFGKLLVQGTDLRNDLTAGLIVRNGSIVDAGQTTTATYTPTNFSGLGISSGQNNFAGGYAPGGAQAIVDENSGGPYTGPGPDGSPFDLFAQGNFWEHLNAAYLESIVRHDFDDSNLGYVDYSSATAQNDLAITAAFTTTPAFIGQHLTLRIKVTNFGPSDATNVAMTANVPVGTTFLSVAADAGTASETAGTVTADIGPLGRGASTIIRIVVMPTATGAITSTANVTSGGTDPELTNNSTVANGTVVNNASGVVKVSVSAGKLVLTGDTAANAVQVLPGATASTYVVLGLSGTQVLFNKITGPTATVTKIKAGLSGDLKAGDDTLIVDGSGQALPLTVTGSVAARLTSGNDTFYSLHVTATGGLAAVGGVGNGTGTVAESTFAKNLGWSGAAGNDALTVSDTKVAGSFSATGGAGTDRLDVTGLTVNKNFKWAGGNDADILNLDSSRIVGSANITAATGADTASVTGSDFSIFKWIGGKDGNSLSVADSVFNKAFSVSAGAGNDTVTVARSTFASTATFNGGADADTLDAGINSKPTGSAKGNSFAKQPVVKNIEIELS
ncbi:MAG TPA: DUF11 domain-containing protein [Gemmataceae bacterium]|nr:DUF11 domain-containing protein [Gemmataceae bacterium]